MPDGKLGKTNSPLSFVVVVKTCAVASFCATIADATMTFPELSVTVPLREVSVIWARAEKLLKSRNAKIDSILTDEKAISLMLYFEKSVDFRVETLLLYQTKALKVKI